MKTSTKIRMSPKKPNQRATDTLLNSKNAEENNNNNNNNRTNFASLRKVEACIKGGGDGGAMTTFFARFDGVTQMLEGLCVSASLTSTTPKTIFCTPRLHIRNILSTTNLPTGFPIGGGICLTFLRLTIATRSNNTCTWTNNNRRRVHWERIVRPSASQYSC